ncbi:hypothetical protein [Streptomyces fulvorobeus]|uniref:PIN domain-containing protein n=1 Tax=Streptomyces fulvorobeus TaxID=284028 RepID=A0A7J0C317_9ACTN|nr:hypothetical protein [Streptomyces fulvorobeus]NYE40622.1 hypothetical protein [Streptomyces fulvorobeus]GFM96919.1 hypothetical protein Sfulv_17300 [Streptomyces fulvorobeus]
MRNPNAFLNGTAVVDSGGLYHIVNCHTREAARLNRMALTGTLRLLAPTVAFSDCCAMRKCWDTECVTDDGTHASDTLREFHARRGVEIIQPSVEFALTAGKLYEHCIAQHVMGSEVLSSCHAALLADREGIPLVSVNETRYCYVPISGMDSMQVHFV